jgi:hypothetical protein
LALLFTAAAPVGTARADDPVRPPPGDEVPQKPRPFLSKGLSLGLVVGGYAAFGGLLYASWWAHAPTHGFEWSHDGWLARDTYSGGADKIGHFFMNHLLTRATAGLLREGGWDPVLSTAVGALSASVAYFGVEMGDAYTTAFSRNDMVANLLGSGFGVLMMQVPWLDERFDTRVQYWPSKQYFSDLGEGGTNFNEDYNGLTFLLAYHLSSIELIEESKIPFRFADVVLGFNTQNYRPRPAEENALQRQRIFIGLTLNLQRVVDELWLSDRHPKHGDSACPGHRFAQFMTEYFNLPFTTLPVFTLERQHIKHSFVDPGN